jgi:hypothetical protein
MNKIFYLNPVEWRKVVTQTEFMAEGINEYSSVIAIDFDKSVVRLKSGRSVAFDGLSEAHYKAIINGEFYESE